MIHIIILYSTAHSTSSFYELSYLHSIRFSPWWVMRVGAPIHSNDINKMHRGSTVVAQCTMHTTRTRCWTLTRYVESVQLFCLIIRRSRSWMFKRMAYVPWMHLNARRSEKTASRSPPCFSAGGSPSASPTFGGQFVAPVYDVLLLKGEVTGLVTTFSGQLGTTSAHGCDVDTVVSLCIQMYQINRNASVEYTYTTCPNVRNSHHNR